MGLIIFTISLNANNESIRIRSIRFLTLVTLINHYPPSSFTNVPLKLFIIPFLNQFALDLLVVVLIFYLS